MGQKPKAKATPKTDRATKPAQRSAASIKRTLATCLGVPVKVLDDKVKVSSLGLAPGPGVNIIMSKINTAFWPDHKKSLTFNKIKNLTIKDLVALIQSML